MGIYTINWTEPLQISSLLSLQLSSLTKLNLLNRKSLIRNSGYLYNTKVWVVDCVDYKSTIKHAGLERVFEWVEKYVPEKVYLTNMSHNIDYHEIITKMPPHIAPLYDGFKIKL